jgi:transcriptional regulator with XRE-family HTH domain
MLHELSELDRIRLEDDLSYGDLARMVGLKEGSTLHRLIKGKTEAPAERTLFKIRKFLAARKATKGKAGKAAA